MTTPVQTSQVALNEEADREWESFKFLHDVGYDCDLVNSNASLFKFFDSFQGLNEFGGGIIFIKKNVGRLLVFACS